MGIAGDLGTVAGDLGAVANLGGNPGTLARPPGLGGRQNLGTMTKNDYKTMKTRRDILPDYLELNITDLRRAGMFRGNWCQPRRIRWQRRGATLGEVAAKVCFGPVWFVQLVYTYQGRTKSVFVAVRVRPSNLGRGSLLAFACPRTGRTVRKLYLKAGAWVSRPEVGAPYASQAHRKAEPSPTVTIAPLQMSYI